MPQSVFLTEEELTELTGCKRPKDQLAALRRQGLNPAVRRDGRPRLLRSVLERYQLGQPHRPRDTQEPNWDSL